MSSVFTVGIGRFRDCTLAQLEADIARMRETHDVPDSAAIACTAPGSSYVFEVIWVGEPKSDNEPLAEKELSFPVRCWRHHKPLGECDECMARIREDSAKRKSGE